MLKSVKAKIDKDNINNIVTINLLMLYGCNYNCSYCCVYEFMSPYQRKALSNLYIEPSAINTFIDAYKKYRRERLGMFFRLVGGEPTIHPEKLIDTCKVLANQDVVHKVELMSNGSADFQLYKDIIDILKDKQLRIRLSYHPEFADFDDFCYKTEKIEQYIKDTEIAYMVYPDYEDVETFARKFNLLKSISKNTEAGKLHGYKYSPEYKQLIYTEELEDNETFIITDENGTKEIRSDIIREAQYNMFKGMHCNSFKYRWNISPEHHLETICISDICKDVYKCYIPSHVKQFIDNIYSLNPICQNDNCFCGLRYNKWR